MLSLALVTPLALLFVPSPFQQHLRPSTSSGGASAPGRSSSIECRTLTLPSRESTVLTPELPTLDASEEELLRSGNMLRWQEPPGAGGAGSGFTVQEICADVDEVWRAVSGFSRYSELIPTVRTARAYDGPAGVVEPENVSRYSFLVSRIRLRLDVRFAVHESERYATWQLDRPSWVLRDSTGYWHVQPCTDRPGLVRVWFAVQVSLTKRVPGFVISLVSRLGLSKATKWLKALDSSQMLGECPLPDEEASAELSSSELEELQRARSDADP